MFTASFEIIARQNLPQQRSALGAKVYLDRYLYPVLVIPLQHNIRLMTPDELPLYDRLTAEPPLDGEEEASIVNEMENLNIAGASSRPRETGRVIVGYDDDETSLIAVDMSITGKLIVGVDDIGRAWVWVGSCDFARLDGA